MDSCSPASKRRQREEHQIMCPEKYEKRSWDCGQEGPQTQGLSPSLRAVVRRSWHMGLGLN